jgi:hypothetical protein
MICTLLYSLALVFSINYMNDYFPLNGKMTVTKCPC